MRKPYFSLWLSATRSWTSNESKLRFVDIQHEKDLCLETSDLNLLLLGEKSQVWIAHIKLFEALHATDNFSLNLKSGSPFTKDVCEFPRCSFLFHCKLFLFSDPSKHRCISEISFSFLLWLHLVMFSVSSLTWFLGSKVGLLFTSRWPWITHSAYQPSFFFFF